MNINTEKPIIIGLLNAHQVIVMKKKNGGYDDEKKQAIKKLEERDRAVRAHESAHVMAAGGYVMGEPTYRTVIGPDGRAYAVEGEVKINVAPVVGDPAATRRKAQILLNAAMAPAGPSGADYAALDSVNELERSALNETQISRTALNPYISKNADHGKLLINKSIDYFA